MIVAITFLITRKFKKTTNVVLLMGLSNAGKTAIFSKLVFNKPKKSVQSLKENEAHMKDFDLKLIDLPGADRLRPKYWDQYRQSVKQIIFVVDSTTVEISLSNCAEFLYSILSDQIVHGNKLRFAIACHKQDIEGAQSKSKIKSILEEELTAIKETKRGQLGRTSDVENEDYLRDRFNDKISLDALKIQFVETSMHNLEQLVKIIF
jgi:signal recognition particle receptor subunit beta